LERLFLQRFGTIVFATIWNDCFCNDLERLFLQRFGTIVFATIERLFCNQGIQIG